MLHILFPCGGFGSTIEFCLRQFTEQYYDSSLDNVTHNPDGSMHGFKKLHHAPWRKDILNIPNSDALITTPLYSNNNQNAQEVIDTFCSVINKDDPVIFVKLKTPLDVFQIFLLSVSKWDLKSYKLNVQTVWEKRELIAITISDDELINLQNINSEWITLGPGDMYTNLEACMFMIFQELKLTPKNTEQMIKFAVRFRNAQQKYFDSVQQVEYIKERIIERDSITWDKLDFLQEVILQSWLLIEGYEIQCYGLDEFPTDSDTINALLIKR
jgi:hypothetical protein